MTSTSADSVSAVLHITAAAGGGADRYIRDLAATTARRHHLMHVGGGPTVVEDVKGQRYVPIANLSAPSVDHDALRRWLELSGIGIVHVHGADEACRAHLDALLRARSLPYLVTLHDLQFVNPRAFEADGMPEPDADWILAVDPMLKRAATVIAPSEFILEIALVCSPGIRATVIAPGVRASPVATVPELRADFTARAPKRTVAVVGAVGPHKGSNVLGSLAAALNNSNMGIVVIGYTDTQISPGWVVPGVLYVHGAYEEGTLAALLAAYRVEAALFPNRLPESFSYTLSEIWSAGVPVVVPNQGALGERVERDGGGWLLPAGFDGDDAAALLVWLSSAEGAAERARVKSRIVPGDARRIPTLEAMSRDVDALYARFGLPPPDAADAGAASDALAPLLAANLDGFAFRKELLKLTGELGEATSQLAEVRRWSEKLERDSAAWAAKLESDITELKREIERLGTENRELAERAAAFDHLPRGIQRYFLRRALRARP